MGKILGHSFGKRKRYGSIFEKPEEEFFFQSNGLEAMNAMSFSKGGYVEPFGKVVPFLHDKPKNLTAGGIVKWDKGEYDPFLNDLQKDNKPVLLEIGSMVVPRPVIHLFHEYEKLYGSVKGPKITDQSKLSPVIIMPMEAIVPAKYTTHFKAFLKTHGVTLPLPKTSYF
jgi:hypothetical protein